MLTLDLHERLEVLPELIDAWGGHQAARPVLLRALAVAVDKGDRPSVQRILSARAFRPVERRWLRGRAVLEPNPDRPCWSPEELRSLSESGLCSEQDLVRLCLAEEGRTALEVLRSCPPGSTKRLLPMPPEGSLPDALLDILNDRAGWGNWK